MIIAIGDGESSNCLTSEPRTGFICDDASGWEVAGRGSVSCWMDVVYRLTVACYSVCSTELICLTIFGSMKDFVGLR